jgi:hypothetical protein
MRTALFSCAFLLLMSCGARQSGPSPFRLRHLPPTPKDVIEAVLANSQAPLSDSSCRGFGTESTDTTVGRYLAGYLAELSNQDAHNAITTSVAPKTEGAEKLYVCRLMIRHAQGEDVWSWGVQFSAKQSDGAIVANSIQCVGAG